MQQRRVTVFVYGTLRAGEANHDLLAGHERLGPARTEPRFELVDLGAYPALVPGGDTAIVGEVYRVDGPTLAALDRLEGHPHFYKRVAVRLHDGRLAQAYVLPADAVAGRPRISGGDWSARERDAGS